MTSEDGMVIRWHRQGASLLPVLLWLAPVSYSAAHTQDEWQQLQPLPLAATFRGAQMRYVERYFLSMPRPFYLLSAAVLVTVLFWGGSQPFAAGLFPAPYDKLAHSLYFGALSLLCWLGTGGRWPVLLFVAVAAIGGLDELHQANLPGRVADSYDFLFDTAAAGLMIMTLKRNMLALNQIRHGTDRT